MSIFPVHLGNGFPASFAGVGPPLPEKYEPPPTYDESLPISAKNHNQDSTSAPEYKQIPSKLMEVFNSIMRVPAEAMPLMERAFEKTLLQEPPTKHSHIVDIARVIFDICENARKKVEGSSISYVSYRTRNRQHTESTKSTANDEQLEENTTSARFYLQHDQDTAMKNQPAYTESPMPFRTNSLKKRNKNDSVSLNTRMREKKEKMNVNKGAMDPGTPASEDSELSSLSCISTPAAFKFALTEETSEQSEDNKQFRLLNQSTDEFVQEAREQIKQFASPSDPDSTHTALISWLQCTDAEKEAMWTNGSEWLSLVEAGKRDRHIGTIKYAITAMAFTRWHESQVSLLVKQSKALQSKEASKEASQSVTGALIGVKPAREAERRAWEQRRKNVGTHLARGRKWSQLVHAFGFGILFLNPWAVAKTSNTILSWFIHKLSLDQEKMVILKGLTEQLVNLFEKGKTDKSQFDKYLRSNDYLAAENERFADSELDGLYDEVTRSTADGRLLIRDTQYTFEKKSLQTLKPYTWLSDDIIVACLHLSDRLDFIRVGKSIPIHQTPNTHLPLSRPFELAATQVSTWRKELGESTLVCFFPLFLHDNHFTLLEINDREGFIYHYNSLKGSNADIKEACEKEVAFSYLQFKEQEAMQQDDGDGCGLMVIKHAQSRMVGRSAICHDGTLTCSEELRHEVISILREAWNNGALLEDPTRPRRKRMAQRVVEEKSTRQKSKRQKSV